MRVKRIHICYVTGNNTLGRPRVILQLLESLRQTMSGCFGQEIFDHKVSARSLGRSLREGGQPEVDMVVELYFIEAEMLDADPALANAPCWDDEPPRMWSRRERGEKSGGR